MKSLVILFILSFSLFGNVYADTAGHKNHPHDHGITASELSAGSIDPEGQEINVSVFGLVCDFCAQAIEKVFMKRNEVSGIKVNLSGGLVAIYTKKNQTLDDAILTKLITDSGYNVDSISRN